MGKQLLSNQIVHLNKVLRACARIPRGNTCQEAEIVSDASENPKIDKQANDHNSFHCALAGLADFIHFINNVVHTVDFVPRPLKGHRLCKR